MHHEICKDIVINCLHIEIFFNLTSTFENCDHADQLYDALRNRVVVV